MTHFLQAYFWFMTAYLLVAALVMLFKWKRVVLLNRHKGMLLENVVGCVLLLLGLTGVYGHLHEIPIVGAVFWQGFVVALGLFSALQYFMPKIQLLRKEKGPKVVLAAYAVGVLMLAPMFGAVAIYGFMSPSLWASF